MNRMTTFILYVVIVGIVLVVLSTWWRLVSTFVDQVRKDR